MTRRRDLMLEDLFGCGHELTLPIVDDDTGTILYWRCVCGQREVFVEQVAQENAQEKPNAKP